ncbi:MAG: beta-galactosidase [Victivallaceae bacterium]|nr:beta-galactosidase [Victivallaceae bacterium]
MKHELSLIVPAIAAALVTALPAAADTRNYFDNAGFETWDQKKNLPTFLAWHWVLPDKQAPFSVMEQSDAEFHSGKYSLHLADRIKGRYNHSLRYLIGPAQLKALAGHKVVFSAWVRQIAASHPKSVGIACKVRGKSSKDVSGSAMIDHTSSTPWQQLSVKFTVPADPASMMLSLHCATGWDRTAEAFFDDIELKIIDVPERKTNGETPRTGQERKKEPEKKSTVKYLAKKSFPDDGMIRPELIQGSWRMNGRAHLFLGAWVNNQKATDWSHPAKPIRIEHPAYLEGPSKSLWDRLGMNSLQISAAWRLPGQLLYGLANDGDCAKQEKNQNDFVAGLKDMPIAVDFAFGFNGVLRAQKPEAHRELDQRNPHWHQFIPYCPENPDGNRYYESFFLGGVRAYLERRANVFLYELFNESSYQCECRWNARLFAQAMQGKYRTIAAANHRWGTVFDSFDEVATATNFIQYRKLWPDWCKFLSHCYSEKLKQYRKVIQSEDRRDKVYFTEQCSTTNFFNERGAGMDYRDIAEACDVLTTEGGIRFGHDLKTGGRNEMEEVVFTPPHRHRIVCSIYRTLSKGSKPIHNHEHYNARFENGKRVPSNRDDLVTSLWNEVMYGISGIYIYVWEKRSWEWRSLEQAKANVLHPSYKSSALLNPYNWPPDELEGFRKFRREIDPYLERIMPCPRTIPGNVACFYSYPTLRMLAYEKNAVEKKLSNWFGALTDAQYQTDIVFDEDICAPDFKRYRALVVPCADYMPEDTYRRILEFAQGGGLVIADQNAMRFNEYGEPLPAPPQGAFIRLTADRADSAPEILKQLSRRRIRRFATVYDYENKTALTDVDCKVIDRGDFKLVFLLSMNSLKSRQIKLKLDFQDDCPFHLYDVGNARTLVHEGVLQWSAADCAAGIPMILKPQCRSVLVLSRTPNGSDRTFDVKNLPAEYRSILREEQKHETFARSALDAYRKEQRELRMYDKVNLKGCTSVDLRGVVNMGFADKVAGDRKGGWFDQGGNDFSAMPIGKQNLSGVPFEIIDPATNQGRSALILFGLNRDFFPKASAPIKVNAFCSRLYFLHTAGWSQTRGTEVYRCRLNYSDGTYAELPMRFGMEIGPWWGVPSLSDAKIALESSNGHANTINLQCHRAANPHADKRIDTMEFLSGGAGAVPAMIAVTLEK